MLDHYRTIAREQAAEDYRHRILCYSVVAPHMKRSQRGRPPPLPEILKGRVVDDAEA